MERIKEVADNGRKYIRYYLNNNKIDEMFVSENIYNDILNCLEKKAIKFTTQPQEREFYVDMNGEMWFDMTTM